MQTMEKEYPLTELCAAFEVCRSGYYEWRERKPSARAQANTRLAEQIQTIRQGEEVCYGSPRMTAELKGRGHLCSENRVARPMRQHDLRAQLQPRFVACPT